MRKVTIRDDEHRRNTGQVVHDDMRGHVYIETFGNHDGVSVHTSIRMDRAKFLEMVKQLGVM